MHASPDDGPSTSGRRAHVRISSSPPPPPPCLVATTAEQRARLNASRRINKSILQSLSLEQLAGVIAEHRTALDVVNTTTALHRLASMWREFVDAELDQSLGITADYRAAMQPVLRTLVDRTSQLLPAYQPWDVAITWWALATLGTAQEFAGVLVGLRTAAATQVAHFNGQDAANVLWACAKLQLRGEPLLPGLLQTLTRRWDELKHEELGMVMWGLAKLRHDPGPTLLSRVVVYLRANAPTMGPRELVSILWAFATLKACPKGLHAAVQAPLQSRVAELGPQDCANSLWAFAKLRQRPVAVASAIADQACEDLRRFKPQELANVVWAVGNMRIPHRQLMAQALQQVSQCMGDFKDQELCMVLVAYMRLALVPPASYLDHFARELRGRSARLTPQALSSVAKAFASFAYPHSGLMAAISMQVQLRTADFSLSALSSVLWAFAELCVYDENLVRCVTAAAEEHVREPYNTRPADVQSIVTSSHRLDHHPASLVSLIASQKY